MPQALAYAQLGGFDPVVGLYASIGALLGYALMGGVREMSVGPEATIALLTASIIAPLAEGDPSRYLALGAGVALMAGILLVLAGIARLGFVTRYLSRPLLVGYVAGSAIVMIVSQLDSLIGITLEAQDDTLAELAETVRRLGETDLLTLAVGLGVIAIVLVVKRIDRRLPAYLVGVLAAIVVSVALGLEAQGVKVVGDIPPGLPPLGLPDIGLADLQLLLVPAAAIGLLIYADSGVTGQVLGRRGGYRVDGDGEFLGLGTANIGASLTGGFPVNGSQSRSFTAADMGARSQLTGLVAVALVVVTLLFLTGLFEPLPKAALAGVIIVVAAGLLDPGEFRRLAVVARSEAALALLAAVIVVAVGMLAGVLVIALLSLLLVAQRAARPATSVPGASARDGQLPGGRLDTRGEAGARHRALPLRWPPLLRQRGRLPRRCHRGRRGRRPARPLGGPGHGGRGGHGLHGDPDARRAARGPRRSRHHRRVRAAQGTGRRVPRAGRCRSVRLDRPVSTWRSMMPSRRSATFDHDRWNVGSCHGPLAS